MTTDRDIEAAARVLCFIDAGFCRNSDCERARSCVGETVSPSHAQTAQLVITAYLSARTQGEGK